MPNTLDVMCKVIPLYRVRLIYEEKDYDYERHIVADSILGLIKGIIDIETRYEENLEKDTRKMAFDIQNFLYMPCAGAKRGFHLFDIDEVDCADWYGRSIDQEIYYHCYFSGDQNVTGSLESDSQNAVYAEPKPVADISPQPHEARDYSEVEKELDEQDAVMKAIYHVSKTHPYRIKCEEEQKLKDTDLDHKAMKKVRKWIKEEETR